MMLPDPVMATMAASEAKGAPMGNGRSLPIHTCGLGHHHHAHHTEQSSEHAKVPMSTLESGGMLISRMFTRAKEGYYSIFPADIRAELQKGDPIVIAMEAERFANAVEPQQQQDGNSSKCAVCSSLEGGSSGSGANGVGGGSKTTTGVQAHTAGAGHHSRQVCAVYVHPAALFVSDCLGPHMHTHTHTHMHARTHARRQTHSHSHRMHARTHARRQTHSHSHRHTHTDTHARSHTDTRTHTHRHTYTRTHTQTKYTHAHTRALRLACIGSLLSIA